MESLQNTTQQQGYALKKGATIWFTGLSGAGKSTLSNAVKERLDKLLGDNTKVFILDGDVIRKGLNKDLGFSAEARAENIRRISEVSKLFALSGSLVFVAFISPYGKDRNFARTIHQEENIPFYEGYINASLEVCEQRDVKGLYKKARAGEIKNFTGISDPYEAPEQPELDIKTSELTLDQSVDFVLKRLEEDGVLANNSHAEIAQSLYETLTGEEASEIATLKSLDIDVEQVEYLQTIAQGWASPLKGFMNELQLLEVIQMKTITTEDGKRHLFSVPITQSLSKDEYESLKNEKKIALKCTKVSPNALAIIENPVFFDNRKEEISTRTFGTSSTKHPKVERIWAQGDYLVSGSKTRFIQEIKFNDGLDEYRQTPQQIHDQIKQRNADAVYAFQVRNPLHNGHVLLLNDTREQLLKKGYKNPVLLLHPLGGWTKEDDAPLDTRIKQHQALLDDGTLNPEHVILAVWPSPMYYAGPTEVLWHASSRVHAGITHFITGRDPAGMKHPEDDKKDLYDVWHGQKLLVQVQKMLNGVEVLPFKVAALHKERQQMEFVLPTSNNADFDFISGTRMRTMAKNNENPPQGFMSQKGWDVLADYYRSLDRQ